MKCNQTVEMIQCRLQIQWRYITGPFNNNNNDDDDNNNKMSSSLSNYMRENIRSSTWRICQSESLNVTGVINRGMSHDVMSCLLSSDHPECCSSTSLSSIIPSSPWLPDAGAAEAGRMRSMVTRGWESWWRDIGSWVTAARDDFTSVNLTWQPWYL